VLKSSTNTAFTDGRTSHAYRAERFCLLLATFKVKARDAQIVELLQCYGKALKNNLILKPHALKLLHTVQVRGEMVVIISEGPHDAQMRTLTALTIRNYVIYLATSNKYGVAKTDGMFPRVLEELGFAADGVVMVGDSRDRNIVPAMEAGIGCVRFNEKETERILPENVMRMRTLGGLWDIC
jgi:putative hydrolase of the HAD superfamily